MKKLLTIVFLSFCSCLCAFTFSACNDNTKAELISASGFETENDNMKIVVSNDTEEFSFLNLITVSKNATWIISTDKYGKDTFATKTVPLIAGDNKFYLLVTSGNGHTVNIFNIIVRRTPRYRVSFLMPSQCFEENFPLYDNYREQEIPSNIIFNNGFYLSQFVEEGHYATELTAKPTQQALFGYDYMLGYTFKGWNFDFTKPIKQSVQIDPIWDVNPELADFEFSYYDVNYCKINAIKNKNLTEINIPDYIVEIDDKAFENCYKLNDINVDDNNKYYKSIDGNLYNKDGTTLIKYATGKTDTVFTIPDSVITIKSGAFDLTPLLEIIIPKNVKTIEYQGFSNYFRYIFYKGSAEDWWQNMHYNDSDFTYVDIFYYSETEPIEDGNYWHYGIYDGKTIPIVWVEEN